jgi:hypothetical protein
MPIKDKIVIFGLFSFIIIGLVTSYFDDKDCRSVRSQVNEGLSKFYSENSISKLTITNGKYGAVNNNFDSLIIDDTGTLDEIRKMVLQIKSIELTRYPPIWTARLEFKMRDNTKFEIWLNKTEAKGDGEYKVYKYGECEESHSLGSKALGDKILGLINSENASR